MHKIVHGPFCSRDGPTNSSSHENWIQIEDHLPLNLSEKKWFGLDENDRPQLGELSYKIVAFLNRFTFL